MSHSFTQTYIRRYRTPRILIHFLFQIPNILRFHRHFSHSRYRSSANEEKKASTVASNAKFHWFWNMVTWSNYSLGFFFSSQTKIKASQERSNETRTKYFNCTNWIKCDIWLFCYRWQFFLTVTQPICHFTLFQCECFTRTDIHRTTMRHRKLMVLSCVFHLCFVFFFVNFYQLYLAVHIWCIGFACGAWIYEQTKFNEFI